MPEAKLAHLERILAGLEGVLVAFSGGVDSSLLLRVAASTLPGRTGAAVARSPAYAREETQAALRLARRMGVPAYEVETHETEVEGYRANQANRCYFCKGTLYGAFLELARREGYPVLVDGTNADDAADHRPGRRAAKQLGVRSPLLEAGLTKAEIRQLARELGLANWDKPSEACLSSRVAYGLRIEPHTLGRIQRAELAVRRWGFRQVRVRDYGRAARVEVEAEAVSRLRQEPVRGAVERALRALGYREVVLDPQGYRTGSLNAELRT